MDIGLKTFNNILLFARKNNHKVATEINALNNSLQEAGFNTFIDIETKALYSNLTATTLTDINHENIDVIVAIGGDGTILRATKTASKNSIPLVGINCGNIGFLTDLQANNFNSLKKILHGQYEEERRFMIRCDIVTNNEHKFVDNALNEISLTRGELIKIIEFDIFINDKFVCNQRADGLIISTPTGSTAYALSAGGPIIQPSIEAISLVPICPHTLNTRPIIIEPHNTIKIKINRRLSSSPSISCDGKSKIFLPEESYVEISKAKSELRLLHPLNYHYFDTLKNKLHWERKPYAEFSSD
jgi:NAD+ kinase